MQVIAADRDEECIDEISEYVEDIVILDLTDAKALREVGIADMDIVVISIGKNIELSILTMMAVKDLTPIYGQTLSKLGVTKVIYPKIESARKLVKKIATDTNHETID